MTGPELKSAREALGMTQTALAEVLGKHSNTIARYERGDLEIPPYIALAVKGLEAK